jgi:hypothetical protein
VKFYSDYGRFFNHFADIYGYGDSVSLSYGSYYFITSGNIKFQS